ncbi:hypothetical protein EOD42_16765 [Rhodovarius crocodyli]|uniref:Uncharacterized protein n=1 Tax=Rhodovarius crocodyli TaxID=1979269 RepID=A0A437MC68_9PROT|nr:hypothetical protein [Rhodovarius crocodyli]RVT95237.1 hypothetical protein EOD42_16765 [Rhodovarius crocodyli]
MSNRKRTPKARSTLPPLDHGPRVQHQTGKLEVVEAPDPDRPAHNVRRARRVYHYHAAWQRGSLTDAEREAADRYAITCEMEEGARDKPTGGPPVRVPPWMQGQPLMTQVQAVTSLRFAHHAVGKDGAALLRLYVRDNLSAEVIASRRGLDGEGRQRETKDVTMGRIRAALGRLAEHWGMVE